MEWFTCHQHNFKHLLGLHERPVFQNRRVGHVREHSEMNMDLSNCPVDLLLTRIIPQQDCVPVSKYVCNTSTGPPLALSRTPATWCLILLWRVVGDRIYCFKSPSRKNTPFCRSFLTFKFMIFFAVISISFSIYVSINISISKRCPARLGFPDSGHETPLRPARLCSSSHAVTVVSIETKLLTCVW